jgi:hypothetical protein
VIPDRTIFLFVNLSGMALLAHKTYSIIMREFFPLGVKLSEYKAVIDFHSVEVKNT